MSQVRRAVAWCTTLTVAFSFTLFSSPAQAADPASRATADAAVAWLKTQQQPDGGFELAIFPGFETRDASLAIAEHAQTGTTWSTTEALDAVGALHFGGTPAGATPLDALDAFGATVTTAGAAAKTIVFDRLAAGPRPVGVRSRRRRHPGEPRRSPRLRLRRRHRLVRARVQRHALRRAREEAACAARRRPPCSAAIRAAAAGERWLELQRRPTGTDVDPTPPRSRSRPWSPAVPTPPTPRCMPRSRSSPPTTRPSGAWQSFGTDDPNSTSLAILAHHRRRLRRGIVVLARHGRPRVRRAPRTRARPRGCVPSSSPRRRPTPVASRARTTASA